MKSTEVDVYELYKRFVQEMTQDTPSSPQVMLLSRKAFQRKWAAVCLDPKLKQYWLKLFEDGYMAAKESALQLVESELAREGS